MSIMYTVIFTKQWINIPQ